MAGTSCNRLLNVLGDAMITRDELRSIPRLHRQIERDKEQLNYLEEKATAIASTLGMDTEKVQSSPKNTAGKYIEAATDLSREIVDKEIELAKLQEEAKVFVDTVTDRLPHQILKLRYLRCCEWNEVADITGYAVRYIQQLESDYTYRLAL